MVFLNSFFVENLKSKRTIELENMINNPGHFQADAVEAAKFILDQRNKGDKEFDKTIKTLESENATEDNTVENLQNFFSNNVRLTISFFALFHIFTALIMLDLISFNIPFDFSSESPLPKKILSNLLISFIYAVYIINFICGILLFINRSIGILFSKILLLIHSFQITVLGLKFKFEALSNFVFSLTIDPEWNFIWSFNLRVFEGNVSFMTGFEGFTIAFNLIPFTLFVLISIFSEQLENNSIPEMESSS